MIGLLGDKSDPLTKMEFPKTRDSEYIRQLVFKKDFSIMRYEYYDVADENSNGE